MNDGARAVDGLIVGRGVSLSVGVFYLAIDGLDGMPPYNFKAMRELSSIYLSSIAKQPILLFFIAPYTPSLPQPHTPPFSIIYI